MNKKMNSDDKTSYYACFGCKELTANVMSVSFDVSTNEVVGVKFLEDVNRNGHFIETGECIKIEEERYSFKIFICQGCGTTVENIPPKVASQHFGVNSNE